MMLMVEAMKAKVGNPGRKLVLVKLADNANDKGECWPSYQHVADQCEMGRSTVKAHVKALEEAGFLTVVERNGGKSSNKYRLHIEAGQAADKPRDTRSNPAPLTRSESDPVKNEPGQDSDTTRSESDPHPRSNPDPRTSHSLEPVIEPVDDACAPSSTPGIDHADQSAPVAILADEDCCTEAEDPFLSSLFGPNPADTLPANTAAAAPAGAGNRFAMHFEWMPTEWFTERCRTAGVSLQRLEAAQQEEILGEFRSYWEARGDQATQAQWEHKLLRQLKRELTPGASSAQATRQQKRAVVSEAIMDINDTDW